MQLKPSVQTTEHMHTQIVYRVLDPSYSVHVPTLNIAVPNSAKTNQTKSGMTPLMCAVKVLGPKDGDDRIVTYLLENKANVNTQVRASLASFPTLYCFHVNIVLIRTFKPRVSARKTER